MSRSQTAVKPAHRRAVWQATLLLALSAVVQSGETATRADLPGSISGIILEPTGSTPVGNAQVDVVGAGVSARRRTTSGADGHYLVSGLPAGSYRVVVTKSDSERRFFTTHSTTNGIGLSFRDASLIRVAEGQSVTGINVRMIRRGDFLGSIAGSVRRAGDGAPIVTGLVQVRAAFSDFADTVLIIDGHYRMDHLPAGNYFVTALSPGFARQVYPRALSYDQASAVTVPPPLPGGSVSGIDFALTAGGSVSGAIRRQSDPGVAVPSAQVAILTETGRIFAVTTANVQGSYRFDYLPFGSYRVGAWVAPAALQNLAFEFYQNADSFSGATAVVLQGADPDAAGIDLTLPDGGAITGVVRDHQGQPVEGANILALPAQNPLGLGLTAVAGPDGSYRIEKLSAGRYIVQSGAPGRIRQFYNGTLQRARATPVDVGAGLTAGGIDFQLDSGRRLNGTVRLGTQTVDGARLLLRSDSADYAQNTRSGPDGAFSFLGAPALGDYRLIVTAADVAPKVVFPVDLSTADGVVNVTLEPGYTLAGRVFAGNGISISGAAVELTHPRLPRSFSIRTDSGGRFSFEHLPAISGFRLAATAPNSSRVSKGNISLETGDMLDVNLFLGVGRSISGRVTLAGVPLVGIHVTAHSATTDGSGTTRTDADGNYLIPGLVPAPDYFVVAGRDSLHVVPRPGRVDLTTGNATGIDIDIPAGRAISGTVTAGGGPLARARVVAWSPTARRGGVGITDLQGAYVIENLPGAADYRLVAVHRGFAPQYYSGAAAPQDATPVDLSTTGASGVDFDLTAGVTLSGIVRDALGVPVGGAYVTVGSDRIYATARADSAGLFETTAVAAGTYDVDARSQGQPGRAVLADVVVGAEPVTDLTLSFPAGGAIEGTVALAGGGDPSQAFVAVFRGGDQGFERLAQAEATGAYRVEGLPAGNYLVAARAEGYQARAYPNATQLSQATPVSVAAGSTATGIDLDLPVEANQSGPTGHLAGAALVISSCSVAPGVWASSTTVTVGWEPVEEAHGYNVAFDHSDSGSFPGEPGLDPDVTVATSETLEDGIYYAHVRSFAITRDPETGLPTGFEWQDETAGPFLLDTTAPASPDGLSSTTDTGQIVLNWVDPATDPGGSGLDRVQVQRDVQGFPGSPDEGQMVFLNALPEASANEAFTDTSVLDGQLYFYSVFAIDAAGNASIPGAQVSDVASPLGEDPDPPDAPTKPAAHVTATQVILNWKNPSNADLQGVEIRYSKQGPNAVEQGQVLARLDANPGNTMTWTHQNPGIGLHYYGIYAFDAAPNYSEAAKVSAYLSGEVPANDLGTLILTGALLTLLGVRARRRRSRQISSVTRHKYAAMRTPVRPEPVEGR